MSAPAETPGLPARELAAAAVRAVLHEGRNLDQAIARASRRALHTEHRDDAFARRIALTVIRRLGELEGVLAAFMERPARNPRVHAILLVGAAQILMLETPAYAAISLAVDQCRKSKATRAFDGLVNAVLRRVSREGAERLAALDAPRIDIPDWLWQRWIATFGVETARRIAAASLSEPPLDITMRSEPEQWSARLGGIVLPTGSLRLSSHGRIETLDGFAEGAWWVQDAAAALPARLLGQVAGLAVADLCAAPGGKTAQLAAAGARVTAVDSAKDRLGRLRENLDRLRLTAQVVCADATSWGQSGAFDAVLLDAPCSATGTIRRHPDILRLKRPSDIEAASALQERLIDNAARLLRPGGYLVYAVCSLEPEEGVEQITSFLARHPDFARAPLAPGEIGGGADWVTAQGDLRTLPLHLVNPRPELSGMDGFFAARLKRDGDGERS